MTAPDRRPLILLVAADVVSRAGSVMTATAIPWFVLVTTGSVTRTGLTVFVEGVAVVIALLFGGVIVDRLEIRRASAMADVAAGVAILLVPVLYQTLGLAFWQLVVLVFLSSLFSIPAQVARYSALPDLASLAIVRFERANSIFDGLLTATSLVGPAAAGVMIVWSGATNVLWVDAATFGLAALMVSLLPRLGQKVQAPSEHVSYLGQLGSGLRFVLHDGVLRPLVVFLFLTNLAIGPIESVFVPVVARDVYHSAYALGWMTSSIAVGALGGNVVFGLVGHRLSRRGVFASGFVTVPITFVVLSLEPLLPASVVLLALVGLGLSLMNLVEYTVLFERLPADMRARGLGTSGALNWAAVPVGRLASGLTVAALGLTLTLGAFALVFLPLPGAVLLLAWFRPLDERTRMDLDAS